MGTLKVSITACVYVDVGEQSTPTAEVTVIGGPPVIVKSDAFMVLQRIGSEKKIVKVGAGQGTITTLSIKGKLLSSYSAVDGSKSIKYPPNGFGLVTNRANV